MFISRVLKILKITDRRVRSDKITWNEMHHGILFDPRLGQNQPLKQGQNHARITAYRIYKRSTAPE